MRRMRGNGIACANTRYGITRLTPAMETGLFGTADGRVTNGCGTRQPWLIQSVAVLTRVQAGISLCAAAATGVDVALAGDSSEGGEAMSQAGVGTVIEKLLTDQNLRSDLRSIRSRRSPSCVCEVSSSPARRSTSFAGRMLVCGSWATK